MVSAAQARALQHVRTRAAAARSDARARITHLLERSGLSRSLSDALLQNVCERARVTVNFHPDRPLADGSTVAEKLLVEGTYRNQFVTRISNGSRTAFPGGDRDRWEEALFGGAYHHTGTSLDERPCSPRFSRASRQRARRWVSRVSMSPPS